MLGTHVDKELNMSTVPICVCGIPMQDSNLIRNFIIPSYPAIMGMTSQDLLILVLLQRLYISLWSAFFFSSPTPNFLPTSE